MGHEKSRDKIARMDFNAMLGQYRKGHSICGNARLARANVEWACVGQAILPIAKPMGLQIQHLVNA